MEYVLKNKNINVLTFEVSTVTTSLKLDNALQNDTWAEEIKNVNIIVPELLPLDVKTEQIKESLEKWIKHRKIPKNRQFVEKIVSTYTPTGSEQLMDYIDVSLGLSLNDSFWVTPKNADYRWENFNLYQNKFDEALELVAFTGNSEKIEGIISSPEFTTNGMLKKCWHRDDNQIYLYKGSSQEFANGGKEAFSEYYMAQIAAIMEFDYVPYDLKIFHNQIVSVCPIFTNENEGYVPMYKILEKNEETDKWKSMEKSTLAATIIKYYDGNKFMDLMLFDSIIFNVDRHLGNFGMIINNDTNELLRPAPIFDNGFSLLNYLTLGELKDIENWKITKTSEMGYTFDEQMKLFIGNRHAHNLEKLTQFEFKKHPQFNISDEWLEPLQTRIQERAKTALNFLNNAVTQKTTHTRKIRR